jgi:cysteine desulfurase
MGVPDALAHASLRITIGRFTTSDEVDFVADRFCSTVERLRATSPMPV